MASEVILVAIDGSKKITDHALEWTIHNVVKPTDTLILLAVLPFRATGVHHFFSNILKKCGISKSENRPSAGRVREIKTDVAYRTNHVCMRMMHRLCSSNDINQINNEVKVVAAEKRGAVAKKARELGATWVILDRHLRKESAPCLKKSECNVILMHQKTPKVLRVSNTSTTMSFSTGVLEIPGQLHPYVPDSSSSMIRTTITKPDDDESESLSNKEKHDLPVSVQSENNYWQHEDTPPPPLASRIFHEEANTGKSYKSKPPYSKSQPLQRVTSLAKSDETPQRSSNSARGHLKSKSEANNIGNFAVTALAVVPARRSTDSSKSSVADRTSSIRKAMSISIRKPPSPPPLCSVCKHNAPMFGKAPRKFRYKDIEQATDGFSTQNFLAEGGNGPVYRGVLPDGLVVAVKLHKLLTAQGASELCSEVEVLSCAQHRNLVMLVGYCTEKEWLLIYEFACNGSLDNHLFGTESSPMTWDNRMKVALGAARGLRYLHEDCRVGSIIHRDFRPNNILLTHDFEPMVGDFGLARCQADGELVEETRVIGSFGYLAPEYIQTGLISEKADVYAFGVVLLELLCGVKATELVRSTGHQSVQEWAQLLLYSDTIMEIIDPRLLNSYRKSEVEWMMHAARLCIRTNHEERPRMSKVLKILEGDVSKENMEYNFVSPTKRYELYNRSSTEKQMVPYNINEEWNLDRSEVFVSEEYETHIQGSLAKFIENLNFKHQQMA